MTEEQREAWREALAAKATVGRRQATGHAKAPTAPAPG
jgi:hypothetical protein